MRISNRSAVTLLLLLAPAVLWGADLPSTWDSGPGFSLLPRAFQKNPHLMVMVVTEFTAAGKKLPSADAGHPQYYYLLPGNYQSVGDTIAGEEPPKQADLENILRQSLAKAGYREADKLHPPTIAVHYMWGSWNKLTSLSNLSGGVAGMGSTDDDDDSDDMQVQNLLERSALVGGTAFASQVLDHLNAGNLTLWENSTPTINYLMAEVRQNRYFLIADAYDYQSALKEQRILLWRTKISTNAQGVTMNESVPQLVASAAPYFGHETQGPVRLNRAVVKEGQVIIGEPTVKGMQAPDDDAGAPAAK